MGQIKYIFKFGANQKQEFNVPDHGWSEAETGDTSQLPDWARLEHKQCPNCPLSTDDYKFCPVSVDIKDITEKFKAIMSYTETKVWVYTDERTYYKEANVQTGLQSLFGLIMARSGCPVLSRLRPMANNHLPFCLPDDAIRRMVGAYMIRQYYRWVDGEEPDFGLYGIEDLYAELQKVNESLSVRLKSASSKDANIEAVLAFIRVTKSGSTIWEHMERLRPELNGGF